MSLTWRVGLVAIVAAAVVGGFMPHGVLVGAATGTTEAVQMAESPLSAPIGCLDVTCGKGNVTPSAPTPGVALAAVLGAAALAVFAGARMRRRRLPGVALPDGTRDPLFHPPQFS